jgi:hypothetical protein
MSDSKENKRHSMAGKIATPKIGPQQNVQELDAALVKAVGARYVSILFSGVTFCPESRRTSY